MRSKRGRVRTMTSPITYVCIVVFVCCLLVVMMSVPKLPKTFVNDSKPFFRHKKTLRLLSDESIGIFGNMIIEMLPQDLAFSLFLPSERAFHRDLGLNKSTSLKGEDFHNTYAILTRILGFSTVPRMILTGSVPPDKEIVFDSISGYKLYVSKDMDGIIIVNRMRSEQVDLRRGEIVVHIMDRVIMDFDFAESVKPDEED